MLEKHRVKNSRAALNPLASSSSTSCAEVYLTFQRCIKCHQNSNIQIQWMCQSSHGLFGMWRSMTVVGSPDGSGCRTLSAFAWRCVTPLTWNQDLDQLSWLWSLLTTLPEVFLKQTAWTPTGRLVPSFEPKQEWTGNSCHSIPTLDLMRRKNHSSLKPSYLRDPGPSWHQGSSSSSVQPVQQMTILTFIQHSFQGQSTLPQRPHPSSMLHCCDGHPAKESTYVIANITAQVQPKDPTSTPRSHWCAYPRILSKKTTP